MEKKQLMKPDFIVNFDTESFIEIKKQIDGNYSVGDMVEKFRSEK